MSLPPSTPIVLALLLGAGLCLPAAWTAYQRQRGASGVAFAMLMLAIAEWELTSALGAVALDLPGKIAWAKVQYLGICSVPVLWLAFCAHYAHRPLSRRWLVRLSVVPVATILLAATNEWHHLVWSSITLEQTPFGPRARFTYGAAFWVAAAHQYLVLLASGAALARARGGVAPALRRHSALLLLGLAAPWLANLAYLTRLAPLDVTPFGFTTAALICWWGLSRSRLLNVVPIARDVAFVHMPDAAIVLDGRGRVADLNPAAEHMLGAAGADVLGQPLPATLGADGHLLDATPGEVHLERAGGGDSIWHTQAVPLRGRPGASGGHLLLLRDLTATRRAEDALIAERDFARQVMDAMGQGLCVSDGQARFTYVNPTLATMLGLAADTLVGRPFLDIIAPDDRQMIVMRRAERRGSARSECEVRLLRSNGTALPVLMTFVPRFRDGAYDGGVSVMTDLTERKRLEDALTRGAQYDPLTDLPNRRLLHERLERALDGRAAGGGVAAVMVIDLDGFKKVNDTVGHGGGDELLRTVAASWQTVLRESDTLARMGGDEFALVVPNTREPGAAARVAARVVEAVGRPFRIEGRDVLVGVSIGIALAPRHGTDAETLLRHADLAMYHAKSHGGGWTLFTRAHLTPTLAA